jgi:hypothetical protein
MKKTRVAILVRIRPTLKAKLVELAKSENRSLNQQIEFLLERSLSRETQNSTDAATFRWARELRLAAT